MIEFAFLVGATLLQVAPAAPAARQGERWTVEVQPGSCRLQRRLVEPRPALLSIETEVGSDDYGLVIKQASFGRGPRGFPEAATVRVDDKVVLRSYLTIFPDDAGAEEANVAGMPGSVLEAMAAGQTLSVKGSSLSIGPLALPKAAAAIAALRRCEEEQLVEWGADPAQFAPGGRQPQVANRHALAPQSLIRRLPMPKGPLRLLHRLLLSPEGKVEQCAAVFELAGSKAEHMLCASLIGRTVGKPALDGAGKPVRGLVTFHPALIQRAVVPVN